MTSKLSRIRRPFVRYVPQWKLVIKIDCDGVHFRGYRRRKWKQVSWTQIASLASDSEPLVKACEVAQGLQFLRSMGIAFADELPNAKPKGQSI